MVRATSVLPKGALGIRMLTKEIHGSLLLLDTWIFHDKKNGKMSYCWYKCSQLVNIMVKESKNCFNSVSSSWLYVQIWKSKWIGHMVVIIAVIATMTIFVCVPASFYAQCLNIVPAGNRREWCISLKWSNRHLLATG